MKSIRILLSLFTITFPLAAIPANAQFGSGIVFDPTQSAHAIEQIQQASELYTTALDTRNEIVTAYNLAYQMSRMPQNFESRYKSVWARWTSLTTPPNRYGTSSPLVDALNLGSLNQAQQGYQKAYVQVQDYPAGHYAGLDSNTQLMVANQYATAELAQSATTGTLASVGTIRSNAEQFQAKLANLEADTYSTDPSEQTENALLGKINSATLLQIHSQQDTNQILAASVEQQLLFQKQQIDAQNRAINNAIYFAQNFPLAIGNLTQGVSASMRNISLSLTRSK